MNERPRSEEGMSCLCVNKIMKWTKKKHKQKMHTFLFRSVLYFRTMWKYFISKLIARIVRYYLHWLAVPIKCTVQLSFCVKMRANALITRQFGILSGEFGADIIMFCCCCCYFWLLFFSLFSASWNVYSHFCHIHDLCME